MTAREEFDELHQRVRDGKRALKVLQGQMRLSIQVLADLDDRLWSLKRRLDRTAEEAQTDDRTEAQALV